MNQVCHRNAKFAEPYIHNISKIQGVLQKALQNRIHPPTVNSGTNKTTLAPYKKNVPIDISNNIKVKVDTDPSPTKKDLKQETKKKRTATNAPKQKNKKQKKELHELEKKTHQEEKT